MQVKAEDYALLANLIKQAKNILILVRPDPTVDLVAAALFLESVSSSLGKSVQIVAKGGMPEGFSDLAEKISSYLETPKLVVSFNWHKNAVEKVSYSLEGERFNFIISPRGKEINVDEVQVSSRGTKADLIFTLGISALASLEDVEKDFINETPIVNIDTSDENELFGRLNFVNKEADSICGVVGVTAEKAQLRADKEACDLLLFGLRAATDGFNNAADPSTFEAAAFLTKQKKIWREKPSEDQVKKPQVPTDWLSPKVFRSREQAS